MHKASMDTSLDPFPSKKQNGPSRAFLGATGLLALLSASCCILPIGLSILGLGGSWLLWLGPFVTYRIPIVIAVGLVLTWAWLRLWTRWGCASRRRSTLLVLILSTVCFIVAATSPFWEEDATRFMFTLWRTSRP